MLRGLAGDSGYYETMGRMSTEVGWPVEIVDKKRRLNVIIRLDLRGILTPGGPAVLS